MIDENLFDVHAGNWDIRFCLYRWKEKLLCAKADNENCNDCDDVMYAHEWRLGLMVESLGQRQPMEENIKLIVSGETDDRTAALSVRPSSESRHTTARSGEMMERVVGRAWTRVVGIGAS